MNIYFLKFFKERGMFSFERYISWFKYGFYKCMNIFNDIDSILNIILVYFFYILMNNYCKMVYV